MTSRFSIRHMILIALAVSTLVAGAFSSAQTKAMVRVPFTFRANHQTFPAGYYKLELLSDRLLSFTDNNSGTHHGVIMVRPEPVPYIETRGVMRFLRSGDRHYLTEIQFAGSSTHSAPVLQPSLARELANNRHAATPVEIAMR